MTDANFGTVFRIGERIEMAAVFKEQRPAERPKVYKE